MPTKSRLTALLPILALTLAGCSESFGSQLQNRRYCIWESGIAPAKVDACLSNTNGSRDHFAHCLHDQLVPQSRINSLYSCVESRASY